MVDPRQYDVTPDGQRFVMIESLEEDRSITQMNVVLNWFEALKAKTDGGKHVDESFP
jgi:hypothetical protein